MARSADPELDNTWCSYGGRGFKAQAVVRALTEWVGEDKDTYTPEQEIGGEA